MGLFIEVTDSGDLQARAVAAIGRYFEPLGTIDGLPAWVTGTTATWSSPAFNREAADMLSVRAGIRRALNGEADFEIVTPGDSKTRRAGVIDWPEQLRQMLGGVDGFVVADDGVTDPRWASTRLMVSGTTSVIGLVPAAGSAGLSKSATFASSSPHTGAIVHVRATGGASVTVTVDGTPDVFTVPASTEWQPLDLGALSDATHTIVVSSTADTFEFLGITHVYATPKLKISNPARSSSLAADWAPGTAPSRWASVIDGPATTPDLFISELGTNAATDLTAIETFYDGLATLGIPVVVVSPGGLGSVDRPRGNVEPMMGKLYQLAQEHDWTLIDFEQVIGQYDAANAASLMADTVHESTRGLHLEALALTALLDG